MDTFSTTEKPLYSRVLATPRSVYEYKQKKRAAINSGATKNGPPAKKKPPTSFSELEKFRIDRRKLEQMMKTGIKNVDAFFHNIMKTTNTFIFWPKTMKLGFRTRKHATLKISGQVNDITWAKGIILSKLAPRGPLINMCMYTTNVSRRGITLTSIMEFTDTVIYNGDSSNVNSVSICGTIDSLEKARLSVRITSPLQMGFEVPTEICIESIYGYITRIQEDFQVKVTFLSSCNCLYALVSGTESSLDDLKGAVHLLANATCGSNVESTLLKIRVEIPRDIFELWTSKKYESITLEDLAKKTNTFITVPKPNKNPVKERVSITGTFENILEARKEFLSQLPIKLVFDVDENPYFTADILSLGPKYGISLNMQRNHKENTETITLEGPEAKITQLYAINQEIMDLYKNSDDEARLRKAYFQALQSDNHCDMSQYDDISKKIWAPFAPSTGSDI